MKKIVKTSKKATQPNLSKTRKKTLAKNKAIVSDRNAINPPWRPRAKSKEEKMHRALRSHPRRERSTDPCRFAPSGCKKLALQGMDVCARHDGAIRNVTIQHAAIPHRESKANSNLKEV